MKTIRHLAVLPLATAFALAACGAPEETAYEADATDQGGGDLIVTQETPGAVPVDLPEAPMTNVPPEEAPAQQAPAE